MRLRFDRRRAAAVHDLVMAAISFVLSLYLRLGDDFWDQTHGFLFEATVLFTIVCAVVFSSMRLYRGVWRYASLNDLIAITKAVSIAILVFAMAMFLLTRLDAMPRSTLAINWLVLMVMLGGPRFLYRLAKDGSLVGLADRGYDARVPVLLVGAGDNAESFIRAMRRPGEHYRVVGLLDPRGGKVGRNIHGLPVLGDVAALDRVVTELRRDGRRPHRLLLADDRLTGATVSDLLAVADSHGMTLARLPGPTDFKSDAVDKAEIRAVAIEDLLGRAQVRLDRDAMARLIAGRRVLITGAGGTIGSELTRQIAGYGPGRLVLVESAEFALYGIDRTVGEDWPALDRRAVLCDVRDAHALNGLFARERPELVLHAAALKHVPIAEENVCETALTNVIGTRNVADASRAHGAAAMVMVSTDKAVHPTSVMGATKRLAESYCQALDRASEEAAGGGTRFVTVRFGNVLGSTGSVVPLFQHQLARGGPLTVTDPDATRYFMTTREAVELILQATALAIGLTDADGGSESSKSRKWMESTGRIFVLDMGEPVRIDDLARQLIRLAGRRPDTDIKIDYIGLRPGEKLHEQLFHEGEPLIATAHRSIRLANPRAADVDEIARAIDGLAKAARARDEALTIARIEAAVPDYRHTPATPLAAQ